MLKRLMLIMLVTTGLNSGIEIKRPNFQSKFNIDLYYGRKEGSLETVNGFVVIDYKGVHFIQRVFTDPLLRGATEKDIINYVVKGNGYFQVIKFTNGTYAIKANQRLLGGKGKKGGFFGGILLTIASLWDRKKKKEVIETYNREKEAAVKFVGEYAGSYAGGVLNVAAGEIEDFVRRHTRVHAIRIVQRFNEGVELSSDTKRELKKAIDLEFSKYSGFDYRVTPKEPQEDYIESKFVNVKPRRSARLAAKKLRKELLEEIPIVMPDDSLNDSYENITIDTSDIINMIDPISMTRTLNEHAEFNMSPALPDGTPLIIDKNISNRTPAQDISINIDPMDLTGTSNESLQLKERIRSKHTGPTYLAMDTISSNGNKVIPESDEAFMDRINMHYDSAPTDNSTETPNWAAELIEQTNVEINDGISLSNGPYTFGARVDYQGLRTGNALYKSIEFFLRYGLNF